MKNWLRQVCDREPDTNLKANPKYTEVVLEPADNQRLANLCGQLDEHLRQIERGLGVEINNRGNTFRIIGEPASAGRTGVLLQDLYGEAENETITPGRVQLLLQASENSVSAGNEKETDAVVINTRNGKVKARGESQSRYMRNMQTHDINFGIGPAGTGKTYLAVACAVEALNRNEVARIILTRPAVEAGERLGFLPGDLAQKIDPYLRPLYDALYEMLGFERVAKLMERNIIEIAPLAYMRGQDAERIVHYSG